MAKPSAPGLHIRKWDAGRWTEAPDAVVTEEPLQLMLDGAPLSVVMRTPGQDVELALGLFYAEGITRSLGEIRSIRMSAEAGESESKIGVDASIVESNHLDVLMAGKPRRKPERSMLASSACGVCGAVLIEDLRRGLAKLGRGPSVDSSLLPRLVERLRSGQGVFERTGGLHAAGLFTSSGEEICVREDIGRHNAVDKVVGRLLLDGRLPAAGLVLFVSGRASFEIVQKAWAAGFGTVVAVSAPSALAVATARTAGLTLAGFAREGRLNVYAPERIAL